MTPPRYMPPMCQPLGPDLDQDLQEAVEERLRELGITHPTETDIARAIAHEEDAPMTNKAPIDLRRFQPGVDAIREAATCAHDRSDISVAEWKAENAVADELQAIIDASIEPEPAFGPWIPWVPGDTIPHEWILADISSEISSGYMWMLSSQVGTRDCRCIRRYCLPTEHPQ